MSFWWQVQTFLESLKHKVQFPFVGSMGVALEDISADENGAISFMGLRYRCKALENIKRNQLVIVVRTEPPKRYLVKAISTEHPQWYDRNPVSKGDDYSAFPSPHGITIRLTYTVPEGKQAMVEVMNARVVRATVPTTAGRSRAFWDVIPNDEVDAIMLIEAYLYSATVGDSDAIQIGATMTLFEGDKLEGRTEDNSSGGTCRLTLGYKITEFDAFIKK